MVIKKMFSVRRPKKHQHVLSYCLFWPPIQSLKIKFFYWVVFGCICCLQSAHVNFFTMQCFFYQVFLVWYNQKQVLCSFFKGEWRGLVVSTENCHSKGRRFKSWLFQIFSWPSFFGQNDETWRRWPECEKNLSNYETFSREQKMLERRREMEELAGERGLDTRNGSVCFEEEDD